MKRRPNGLKVRYRRSTSIVEVTAVIAARYPLRHLVQLFDALPPVTSTTSWTISRPTCSTLVPHRSAS